MKMIVRKMRLVKDLNDRLKKYYEVSLQRSGSQTLTLAVFVKVSVI